LKGIYLSLGSNIGDRLEHLKKALDQLDAKGVRIQRISKVYETDPVGYLNQGRFLNLVAEVETDLFPLQLLRRIHTIERLLKRHRTIRNGPRTIDIDIVFYGNASIKTMALEIPHPRYRDRAFVLAPLSDLIRTGLPFHPPREYSQSIANSSRSAPSLSP